MNRQALAPLLVGVISVGSGLWVATQLRIGRCLDAGGQWDPLRRACELPPGVAGQTMQRTVLDHAIGGVVAIAFAYLLMRMWSAVMRKKARQLERERYAAAQAAQAPSAGAEPPPPTASP